MSVTRRRVEVKLCVRKELFKLLHSDGLLKIRRASHNYPVIVFRSNGIVYLVIPAGKRNANELTFERAILRQV